MRNDIIFLLLAAACFAGCCVIFGAELHRASLSGVSYSFNWQAVSGGGVSINYSQISSSQPLSNCASSGSATIAMAVFGFLCFLAGGILRLMKCLEFDKQIPYLGEHPEKYSLVELLAAIGGAVFLVLCVFIWGPSCIKATNDTPGSSSVAPSGYVYIVFCMILAVINIFLLQHIHSEASSVPGGQQAARPSAAPAAKKEEPRPNASAPADSPAAAV